MQTIYFILAVAVVSTIIFVLTTRADHAGRRGASDSGSSDPGTSSGGDATWWFGNHSSQFTDASGSWDSGGGWSGSDGGGSDGGGSGSSD